MGATLSANLVEAVNLDVAGFALNFAAFVIITVILVFTHQNNGPDVNEQASSIMLYIALVFFIGGFVFLLWSSIVRRSDERKRLFLMEKHWGLDLSDTKGVTLMDVDRHDQAKAQGQTNLKKLNHEIIRKEGSNLFIVHNLRAQGKPGTVDDVERFYKYGNTKRKPSPLDGSEYHEY